MFCVEIEWTTANKNLCRTRSNSGSKTSPTCSLHACRAGLTCTSKWLWQQILLEHVNSRENTISWAAPCLVPGWTSLMKHKSCLSYHWQSRDTATVHLHKCISFRFRCIILFILACPKSHTSRQFTPNGLVCGGISGKHNGLVHANTATSLTFS